MKNKINDIVKQFENNMKDTSRHITLGEVFHDFKTLIDDTLIVFCTSCDGLFISRNEKYPFIFQLMEVLNNLGIEEKFEQYQDDALKMLKEDANRECIISRINQEIEDVNELLDDGKYNRAENIISNTFEFISQCADTLIIDSFTEEALINIYISLIKWDQYMKAFLYENLD